MTATTVLGSAAALIVWEALVALVARRRPVPLIVYAIGLIAASVVAGILLVDHTATTSALAIGSALTGFLAALGFVVIWQLVPGQSPGATGTAVRVGRTFVLRGVAFSVLVLVIAFIIWFVRHG